MSKLYLGSIDLNKINNSDIVTTDKEGNPFQNGAKYLNIALWVSDEPDKYGNHVAIKSGKKDANYYIGNCKHYTPKEQAAPIENETDIEPASSSNLSNGEDDDLPF